MKCSLKHRALVVVYLTFALAGGAAFAQGDFTNNFDSGYAEGDPITNSGSWTANSSVIATSTPAYSGSFAAYIPDQEALTNTTAVGGGNNTWVDMQVQITLMNGDPSAPKSDMAAQFYFDENGYPVVLDGPTTNWVTISNVMRNASFAAVNPVTSGWYRVAVFMNYDRGTWALFVDNQMIDDEIAFHGSSSSFSKMIVENQTVLDDVAVQTAALTGSTASSDSDEDGMGDVFELKYWGIVTIASGSGDADSDGRTNSGEEDADSNPFVADYDSQIMPYRDDFESASLGLVTNNNWRGIITNAALTVVSDAAEGSRALQVVGGTMSVTFTNSNGTNAWVQIYSKPTFYDDSSGGPSISSNDAASFYVSTGGVLMAYDGNVSNFVAVASGVPEDTWLAFAAHLDYTAQEWNLYVSTSGVYGESMFRTNASNLGFNPDYSGTYLTNIIVSSEGTSYVDVVAASFANTNLVNTHTNVVAYDRIVGSFSGASIPPYDFGTNNVVASNSLGGAVGSYLMWGMDADDLLHVSYSNGVNAYSLESGTVWQPKDGSTLANTNIFLTASTALSMKKIAGRDTVVFYPYEDYVPPSVSIVIESRADTDLYGWNKLSASVFTTPRTVNAGGSSGLQFTGASGGDRIFLEDRTVLQYNSSASEWRVFGSRNPASNVIPTTATFFYYNSTSNDFTWSPTN